jgi:uncharacterized protein DUF2795
VERGSDKHNPRVDEGLKHATESMVRGSPVEARADEAREQEGPGDGEPTPDARLAGDDRAGPGDMTYDELEARTELARRLPGSVFPGDRDALIAAAKDEHAPDDVMAQLRRLPDGSFDNVQAVWEALGGRRETHA